MSFGIQVLRETAMAGSQEEGSSEEGDATRLQLSRRHEVAFGVLANLLSHGGEVVPYLQKDGR